jgi:uncharacterized protein YbjT (DUF2867 family)
MKIVVTGSLGNISKPLTQELVKKGHSVTVISTNPEKKKDIEALGAKAAIGSIEDVTFLIQTFAGADVVYLMEAVDPKKMFDPNFDIIEGYSKIARSYKKAVEETGVKKIIHLSSIGAHTTEGVGILSMHYYAEQILNELPKDVAIKFMRPVGFYVNLYRQMQNIKSKGSIIYNYGGDKKEPWVSPLDIASAIVEEMELPFNGREIRYIASEEISPNEMANVLGKAIDNSNLDWKVITDEELLNEMLGYGMNNQIANGFVDMQSAQGTGKMYEDYYKNKPVLGKTKFEAFAKEFATAFKA